QPCAGGVALVAGLGEVRADVVGIGGALIILEVAAHAGCGIQAVIVIHVAIGAVPRRNRVQSGERETGRAVVECGVGPVRGGVALITGLREIRGDVIGIGGALVILQVAGHTRRTREVVIVVDVAIHAGARRNRVHPG